MPRVSCIMAAHNAAGTIAESIASVLCQSVADLELIVVDDGSEDGTWRVLDAIEDPRVIRLSQARRGPSAARNFGIAQSRGEFIAVIDADDIWLPRKLEWQLAAMERQPAAGLVYGWTDFVDEQLKPLHPDDRQTVEGWVLGELLRKNFICCGSNTLMRRSAIAAVGAFDEQLGAAEDWELHARLAAHSEFAAVPEVVVLYRESPQSLSSRFDVMERNYRTASRKIFRAAPAEMRGLEAQANASFYRYLLGRTAQSKSTAGKWLAMPRYAALAVWYRYSTMRSK